MNTPQAQAHRFDPFAGEALYRDVERYAAFGVHRYGSPGERAAMVWIHDELAGLGLEVRSQALSMSRQYELDEASVGIEGEVLPAFPHWWMPEGQARFSWQGRLVADGEAHGQALWLQLPRERNAYLNDQHREAITAAARRQPALILLTIDSPSDELYTYNVNQEDAPWPVPVVMVAAAHKPLLARALASGSRLSVQVQGRYCYQVPGRNVIARLDRGADQTLVVSTPVSSWFVSACERGPGIATFLAMAREVAAHPPSVNVLFVATAGHEIGHGGMEAFLAEGAPSPQATCAWIHLGASHASHRWERGPQGWRSTGQVDDGARMLVFSPDLAALARESFEGVAITPFLADKMGVGELREVKAAGYRRFMGVAGSHHFFHSPGDTPEGTSPRLLEPVGRAFARALAAIAPPAG